MTLPLHIFEPRYRQMINRCIAERQPFGVTLIRAGAEVGASADPHAVGTLGAISRVERLADGRMNIEVVGQERFRLLALHDDQPYLTGTVEKFPLPELDPAAANLTARRLTHWVGQYLQLLSRVADIAFDRQGLPASPAALAYFAAIIAQVPNPEKQGLLECPSVDALLARECTVYRREISLIRAMLARPEQTGPGDFSAN